MELHKNQMLQFSSIVMTRVHETSQKSNASIFFNIRVHKTSQKSNASIFFNFHDPGYMKHHKNQILIFIQSSIGVRILPTPASSPPRLLSSTRFPATCALVGNRATKVRL